MNRNLLQRVLRHADGLTADADADAHLLLRFAASRDEAAFAALVKRHGPMVWAVCRQSVPNHADAEDAFQATFLALARSAKTVRTPERLAGWLHAAAVRIAGKAKRSFTRRAKHEQATARPESDSPVSAAAWNDLMAAVHAEVSALPPGLRAVFVLCDLEGVDPAEAAKRLGLKGGTLSGQLARARQRMLAGLSKRGVAAGAVALGTAVAIPEALANKTAGVVGSVPTPAVCELASEVTTMTLGKLKLLAAGLLVAGGLGVGLLANAIGQSPPSSGGFPGGGVPGAAPGGPSLPGASGPPSGVPGSPGGLGGPGMGLPGGLGGAPPSTGGAGGEGGGSGMGAAPAASEHLFVGKPNTVADVAKLLKGKSSKGWEYTGPLDVDPSDPPKGKEFEGITKDTRVVLVFKKRPGPMGMGGPFGSTGSGGWGGSSSNWGSSPGGMPGPGLFGGSGGGTPGFGGGVSSTAPAPGGTTGPSEGSGPGRSIDGRPNVPGTGKGTAPGPGATRPRDGGPGPGIPGSGTIPGPGVSRPRDGGEGGGPLGSGAAEKLEGTWKTIALQSSEAEVVAKAVLAVYGKQMPGMVAMAKGDDQLMVYASSESHDAIAAMARAIDKTIIAANKPAKPAK